MTTEKEPNVRKDEPVKPRFRKIPRYPDYMIDKQGCVKHIATGRYCLFLRLTSSGGVIISIQHRGKSKSVVVQDLVKMTYPENFRNDKGENDGNQNQEVLQ